MRSAGAVGRGDTEVYVFAHHRLDRLVLANIELVMFSDFAVILQSLFARGLLVGGGERNLADLEKLRRSEKQHACGIVKERIYQTALVDDDHLEAKLLRLDGAGQARRSGSNDQDVSSHLRVRLNL